MNMSTILFWRIENELEAYKVTQFWSKVSKDEISDKVESSQNLNYL